MGEQTAISWCDHTFNMWWGCWKIADECKFCYADSTAARYAPGHWGREAPRRFFGDDHWKQPIKWNAKALRDGVRRRVFVGSMMDWAEQHPDPEINRQMDAYRGRLWKLIDECRGLDWLLLTKRIDDVDPLLPWTVKPWPHVWIGVTAGTRESLAKVITLRTITAAVRFVSCEPLLEHITATDWDSALGSLVDYFGEDMDVPAVNWLIVGNESGPKRRPAQLDWVRTAREAAARHAVAFHFKQWVEANGKKTHLPVLDGRQHAAFPEVARG